MPNQRAKNKVPFNLFIDQDLKDEIKAHAERTGTDMTSLVSDLLSVELKRAEKQQIAGARAKAGKPSAAGR